MNKITVTESTLNNFMGTIGTYSDAVVIKGYDGRLTILKNGDSFSEPLSKENVFKPFAKGTKITIEIE